MHVSSKDSSKDGRSHVLTSTLEADGAAELVSIGETLEATVVSVSRTSSGGIELVTEIKIVKAEEAAPELPAESNAVIQ